jgi:endoglucanase
MTKYARLAVLLLAISALGAATAARAADGRGAGGVAGAFRRGIGVGAMAWAAVEPGAPTKFVFPPFAGPPYELAAGELRALQHSGFGFIRLAVDPGPFLQFNGARQKELDRILMDRVHLILASGLSVLVDFHPSDMNPDYLARVLTGGLHTPVFQSYLRMLQHTARLLGRLQSRRVALELINEPPVAPEVWQPMLGAAYAAARSGSPDLTLLLEGGDEASAPALMQMNTAPFAADPAVLYSFHYYEPYQFTHEGASWNPARYLADVPYPADAHPIDESLAATAASIAATNLSELRKSLAYQDAQARLENYAASGFDGGTIKKSFAQIADWARARGIPADRVILGEFGARETASQHFGERARERAQWFHDVRTAAEAMGFGWSVWAYRGGGGFALAQSDTSDDIEADIAAALGLRPLPDRKAAALPASGLSQLSPRPAANR